MMNKSLVIVESPAKAKTINKYLGKEYLVRSCVGHIRDLPAGRGGKIRKANEDLPQVPPEREKYARVIRSMGVNPYKNWEAKYETLPGKENIIKELKGLAKDAKDIYLATDLDREGEAIAWNLTEVLGKDKDYKRVIFTEITKDAIQKAFKNPLKLDDHKVQAQQARRFLDRVVGYMLSPLLWKKVARGLSAGRVQSVAVKLIVERERAIRKFIPREFWTVDADVTAEDGSKFVMQLAKHKGKRFEPSSKKEVDKALNELKKQEIIITEIKKSKQKSSPPPPFITSTLQQSASTRLGFTVKRTMIAAQKLYEAGLITYMRTDSLNVSKMAMEQNRHYISREFKAEYLPPSPRYYKTKSSQAQEAHEAIRPSSIEMRVLTQRMGDSELRLYDMIYARFLASQMADAIYNRTRIKAQAGDYELQVSGRTQEFDGFTKVTPVAIADKLDLPENLKEGGPLKLNNLLPEQHFTKPPARFNEASLVKELEGLGIGRPSTYAPIISTIQDRGYTRIINKRFYAEKIAEIVTDRLGDSFPNLLAYDFTASMEDSLDAIARNDEKWIKVLDNFYTDFITKLEKADGERGMKQNSAVRTKISCSSCGRPMVVRTTTTGIFLGCSGYDDKENPCKNTINLLSITEDTTMEADEEIPPQKKELCDVCKSPMNDYVVDAKTLIYVCERNPDCEGTKVKKGDYSDRAPKKEELECDRCGGSMELKSGRFGKYFICTNDECGNKRRVMSNGQVVPPRMAPIETDIPCSKYPDTNFVIREGALGLFLAAPGFPKQRETRSPYVKELIPYKDRLDAKFHFLLDAPQEDKEGSPFQVRYSRKRGENYVATINDKGRPQNQVYYENNKWRQVDGK